MDGAKGGPATHNARVLIVDADSRTVEVLAAALSQKMIPVDVARDPAEAAGWLARNSYSVAVVDLSMLEDQGRELVAALESVPREARPIVMATAASGRRTDLDSELVQVIIRKPIRIGELAEMIRACIDSESSQHGGPLQTRRPPLDLHRD